MSTGDITRFNVLMDLAETIADKNKPMSLIFLRTPEGKWIVALHDTKRLNNPLPSDSDTDNLERALETFVISPRK